MHNGIKYKRQRFSNPHSSPLLEELREQLVKIQIQLLICCVNVKFISFFALLFFALYLINFYRSARLEHSLGGEGSTDEVLASALGSI